MRKALFALAGALLLSLGAFAQSYALALAHFAPASTASGVAVSRTRPNADG